MNITLPEKLQAELLALKAYARAHPVTLAQVSQMTALQAAGKWEGSEVEEATLADFKKSYVWITDWLMLVLIYEDHAPVKWWKLTFHRRPSASLEDREKTPDIVAEVLATLSLPSPEDAEMSDSTENSFELSFRDTRAGEQN